MGTGLLYGVVAIAVSHPFDVVKTKMQAQEGFLKGSSMIQSFQRVFQKEGIRGLYRGCLSPLFGSGLYRSAQFSIYEGLYTKWGRDNDAAGQDIPWQQHEILFTSGLQYRVLMASFVGSFGRSLIESPIEYVKVKRQTGQSWQFMHLYKGFGVQWIRTWGLMTTYFIIIDNIRRKSDLMTYPAGQFLASGFASCVGFWVIWPFEVLKNQVQADTEVGTTGKKVTLMDRARLLIKDQGIKGLYRGIVPGTIRAMIANGVSMIAMIWAQKKITQLGWR